MPQSLPSDAIDLEVVIERRGLPDRSAWVRLMASGGMTVMPLADAESPVSARVVLPEAIVRRWVGISGRKLVSSGSLFAHIRVIDGQEALEEFLFRNPTALTDAEWTVLSDWVVQLLSA